MNYQQVIRNLVVEGHMSLEEVLDLTPYQIAALTTDKSTPPGDHSPEMLKAMADG